MQEVLQILSQSSSSKLGLITVAPYNEPSNVSSYINERLAGNIYGSDAINTLVAKFRDECGNNPQCFESLAQSLDYTQSTINAVAAYLKAFQTTHAILCGNTSKVCSRLSNSQEFYSTMLSSLSNTNLNTTIGSEKIAVRFDQNGDLDPRTLLPAYTLHVAEQSGKWKFTNVGRYQHNGSWSYNSNANQTLFSNTNFVSRCSTGCEKCQKETAPYLYRRSNSSKYIIAGTAAVNDGLDQHTCGQNVTATGFVVMTSFYYAVEQIKKITGIEFSTLFIDTCYAQLETHNIMNQIFRKQDVAYLEDANGKEWKVSPSDFVVFIGDASSGISIVLQNYLRLYKIPQISYRSTSSWLSEPLRYPTFLRNVPSDHEQARLMMEIVEINKWENIGLISSESVYGQTGGELIKNYANKSGKCISFYRSVTSTADSISDLVHEIKQSATKSRLPRPIIIFAEEALIKDVLQKIKDADDKWTVRGNILIGSETWNRLPSVIQGSGKVAYGALSFAFSDSTFRWTDSDGNNDFVRYLKTQNPQNNQDNYLFNQFWQQTFNCYLEQDPFKTGQQPCSPTLNLADSKSKLNDEDVVGKHMVMAGLSVAYSIIEATAGKGICSNSETLFECYKRFNTRDQEEFLRILRTTKIPQYVKSRHQTYTPYLPSGDGKINYKVYNIVPNDADEPSYKLVYNITDGKINEKEKPQYYYNNGDRDPEVTSKCIGTSCQCIAGTGVGTASQDQSPDIPEDVHWIAPGYLLPILVVGIVLLFLLVVGALVYCIYMQKKSKRSKAKYSQVPLDQHSNNGNSYYYCLYYKF